MNHLLRAHAPISDAAWAELEAEAVQRLTASLGARKLVDHSGPHGWSYSATNLGRTEEVADLPTEGIAAVRRKVLPLTEVRADFTVDRNELLDLDRGAQDTDLSGLDEAAMRMAATENIAVFHGWNAAGIGGVTEATPHPAIGAAQNIEQYPRRVAKAVETLLGSGISGPYGLALGPADYTAVTETAEHGGYPLFDHLHKILNGPIVWTPGVRGGVVLSVRGGDFLFESGQDVSLGYDSHTRDTLHLYLQQTFSFRVTTAEAAVELAPVG